MNALKSKRSVFRRLIKSLVLFFLAWILWTVWPVVIYRKMTPVRPLSSVQYLKGAYHMHSQFSDGKGPISDLVRAAKEAQLNWIILTDHGGPNREAENVTGWYGDILLIGASELSSDAGHLVVIGSDTSTRLPYEPQLAIDTINRRKGLSIIAHPYDNKIPWTDWTVSGFTGMEIFSVYESVKSASWHRILQFPVQYLINPDFAILRMLTPPKAPLNQWNRLHRERADLTLGFFASDAHGRIPLGRKLDLPIPSYRSMFSSLVLYTPRSAQDFGGMNAAMASRYVLNCLKRGDFLNVIESMASADGVEMQFTPAGTEANSSWTFSLRHPYKSVSLNLFRNGALYHRAIVDSMITHNIDAPGRYRAELYLLNHSFSHLPWIVGNPVDLPHAPEIVGEKKAPMLPHIYTTLPFSACKLEKNAESYAELFQSEAIADISPFITMRYSLRIPSQGKDSWCSLAVRDAEVLAEKVIPHDGILLDIASDQYRTLWLEIRTVTPDDGIESWYRHSVVADPQRKTMTIPFSDMHQIHGPSAPLDNELISALFLSVNSSTAFIPSDGEIQIFQLGGYRTRVKQIRD